MQTEAKVGETEFRGGKREILRGFRRVVVDPMAAYALMKLIDRDPREGGSIIMNQRVRTFCNLHRRQFFYEPLSSYDSILRVLEQEFMIGRGAWVDEDKQDWLQISFDIFEGAYTAPRGRLDLPPDGERAVGIHAVAVCGWDEDRQGLVFRNSWGAGWGDRGHGSISRTYLGRYLRDAWLSRNARYGFTRFDRTALLAASTEKDQAAIWLRENPRWRYRINHRGERKCLRVYETISAEDEIPVTIIELRTPTDFRLGWAMLFHEHGKKSVLKELFVWPAFRRRGYGTLLEGAAVQVARQWNSTTIEIYLHSADALPWNPRVGSLVASQAC